jgi:hypothetical protein
MVDLAYRELGKVSQSDIEASAGSTVTLNIALGLPILSSWQAFAPTYACGIGAVVTRFSEYININLHNTGVLGFSIAFSIGGKGKAKHHKIRRFQYTPSLPQLFFNNTIWRQ